MMWAELALHAAPGLPPYTLKRSRRRRTLEIRVGEQGVVVYAPSGSPRPEIEGFLRARADWIARALRRHSRPAPATPDHVHLLGEPLRLVRVPGIATTGRVADEVWLPEQVDMRGAIPAWLRTLAMPHYRRLAADFAARLGRPEPPLRLSTARTQWGSCNARGHIAVHWRLIQAPAPIAEYVVAHEVAHLVHLNHSPEFWRVVAGLIPDWRARRASLHEDMGRYLSF